MHWFIIAVLAFILVSYIGDNEGRVLELEQRVTTLESMMGIEHNLPLLD